MRAVQVFVDRFGWQDIEMKNVRRGDVFRILDDKKRHIDEDGNNVWVAINDAYKNADGVWAVKTLY